MSTITRNDTPLLAVDRCDRCGAQAKVRVTLSSGGELLFCGHHARDHEDKITQLLVGQGAHVYDERTKIGMVKKS